MSSEEQPKRSAEPVGYQLRRAREKLGLDVSAIADQQHLRTSVIQAIEDGDYSKVDTELFLKGYVRAYAKQVELDADAIIRDLDAELEPLRKERERQHEADPLVDIQRKKSRKRRIARAVVVLVVLVGIGFGITTWMADGGRRLPGFSPSTVSESTEGDSLAAQEEPVDQSLEQTSESSSAQSESDATPEVDEAVDVQGVDDGATDVIHDPVEQATEEAAQAPTESAAEASVETASVENVTDVSAQPEAIETTESAQVTEQEPQELGEPAVTDEATLRMSFSDACWVQVTDADGNRLTSSLYSQGDVLDVAGSAPLDVIVGAMSAVASLEFQGEAVDLGSFRVVNNRAQFTLEP
ncbi:RodZ domain-containing protein [Marinobacter persicus]|uniref:Cytoskeleton protein RodZ n=1 Tax=Marinobacter persicus TaxID=930118 RepID=A0A2S6G7L5_9GAMM|nr:RodZ domain-containing protein [Marinobacter persicus]PPK52169.1 cytoskeleton protein RodZ [Marinobacter persicus]PPK55143.1 cytoskeleton protein RodZ [Marinobacter persicus]PPK58929.1 cytoskeleton protein RodZ [Marinobacter persicus]